MWKFHVDLQFKFTNGPCNIWLIIIFRNLKLKDEIIRIYDLDESQLYFIIFFNNIVE